MKKGMNLIYCESINAILMYYQVAFFYYIGISILLKMIWCLRDKWEMFMENDTDVGVVCACFYDEDDNFRDKDWILTSYDNSRKEDKIRKSSTILNRPDSSNDTDSARRNSLISSGALSLPKDISYLLNEQQLMDEIIEKAKQGSPVGREKMLES